MTTAELVCIPKRFYDDHVDRDLPAPEIVRETQQHYFIDATSEHLDEFLCDANHFADPVWRIKAQRKVCFDFEFGTYLAALIRSARATERAVEKHLRTNQLGDSKL